jgi:putative transposase
MRVARILGEGEAFYHILSRIVDRRLILDDTEKERFRRIMRAVEAFSGCQVLTWACLSNHWHICLRVPEPEPVTDRELIRRLHFLYDKLLWNKLQRTGRSACQWQGRRGRRAESPLYRRMYNLSEFVKTLKQRFTMSYNRRHNRQGTLWESRFKSVLLKVRAGHYGRWPPISTSMPCARALCRIRRIIASVAMARQSPA